MFPLWSVSGRFVTPSLIVSLVGRKRKGKKWEDLKRKIKIKNKPPADFKSVQQVLLVFLDGTERGGLGFTFLPSYGFERMGTKSGLQYSQFPGLQPRSCMSCQVQISHSSAHSISQYTMQSPRQGGHMVLLSHSLWAHAAEITLRARQPLLGSSLQSSCPQFLTSPELFTQPNFPISPETIQVKVPHGPTPPFSRCRPAPQFLSCQRPHSQQMYTASVCLPLHLYFPHWLPASGSFLVLGCPPCSGRGGSWYPNSPPHIMWQVRGQGAAAALVPAQIPGTLPSQCNLHTIYFSMSSAIFCLPTSYKLEFHWLFTLFLRRSARSSSWEK